MRKNSPKLILPVISMMLNFVALLPMVVRNIHHQQRRAISPPQVVTPPDSLIPQILLPLQNANALMNRQAVICMIRPMVWGVLRKWWIYRSNNHRLSQLHASKIFLIAMHHCIIILLAYALQPTLPIQTCLSLVSAKLDVLSMYADRLDHISFCSQSLVILIPKNWGYSLPVNLLVDQTPCHYSWQFLYANQHRRRLVASKAARHVAQADSEVWLDYWCQRSGSLSNAFNILPAFRS
jgi:hypothetical protein